MSQPTTHEAPIEKIAVEEGFNPRSEFDEGSLAELEASIRQSGVVTALTVKSDGNGGYVLVAGERRLRAAKRAGLKSVPVMVIDGEGALAASIVENLIRADLDPIEEAGALARLAEAEQLGTHRKIAKRIGKSSAYVSERLRLLKLPEAVQAQIAAGKVPVAAERDLRRVAAVSPEVAMAICQIVAAGEIEGPDLLERFGDVLHAVARSESSGAPTMFDANRHLRIADLIEDPEQQAALVERVRALSPYESAESAGVRLSEAEVDAARAAGCLLEHEVDHGEWSTTLSYVCDLGFAADLVVRAIERMEAEAAERGSAESEQAPVTGSPNEEEQRAERRAEREKAKRKAARARRRNLDLGVALLARRGAKSRKEHSLARAQALATLVLEGNRELVAAGLRLALPQLQEVEVKTLKSGEQREKVTYADTDACSAYLAARVSEARSEREVLELLADALLAAFLVDPAELAQSRRVTWFARGEAKLRKLLAPELKALRPSRRSKA